MPHPMSHSRKRNAPRRPRLAWVASFLVMGALLMTCVTPTPYQPADQRYGYSQQQIETGRYQVSFSGNSLTDQKTVENYLLFRAAEITVESGNDYFVVAARDTKEDTTYRATPYYFPNHYFHYSLHYGHSPYYGRYGRYGGYGGYGRYGGFGLGYDYYSQPITRYTATADIVTYRGDKPEDNASAYDARDVMRNLGPNIVRPENLTG